MDCRHLVAILDLVCLQLLQYHREFFYASRFPRCYNSINEWATACLKKHMAALGRKTATVNVYDIKSGIAFTNAAGEVVPLNSIQTVLRLAHVAEPPPVVSSPANVGGGGSQPAPVVPPPAVSGGGGSETMEEIAASQGSQLGQDCERCGNFVADDEKCPCEPIVCKACDTVIAPEDYVGDCVGCDKPLGNCCGAIDGDDAICHPCSTKAEDEPDLDDIDVKGAVMLFNPTSGEVFLKKANGTPGDKVSTYKDGVHVWEWSKKKIGDTFYLVNHFNYVKQTATAGKAWVGIYNPATKALDKTPVPEDY